MASKITVMLLAKVPRVGSPKDVLEVKKGFAMNYLIPQGLAKIATKHDIEQNRVHEARLAEKQAAMVEKAKELAETLEKDSTLAIAAKVNEKGGFYGSVTETEIAEALTKKLGVEITPQSVRLKADIKEAGDHKVSVKFAEKVMVDVTVNVTAA